MKKYLSLLLALISVVALASCTGSGTEEDGGKALETADSHINIENNGGSITLSEDAVKILLGAYSPEKLGLKNEITEYTLKLSSAKYNGAEGCKVEAFYEKSETAEGTFMIVGNSCYVYSKTQMKYVPLSTASKSDISSSAVATTGAAVSGDPEITFQYHKGNNELMRKRFAEYDIAKLGLTKSVNEYVFVVNGRGAEASDGAKVYCVDVLEKNGDGTGVKLAFSEDGEYVFSNKKAAYEKLNK